VLLIGMLEIAPIRVNLCSSFEIDPLFGIMKSHNFPYAKLQNWFNYDM
jgi:hypothetical protein